MASIVATRVLYAVDIVVLEKACLVCPPSGCSRFCLPQFSRQLVEQYLDDNVLDTGMTTVSARTIRLYDIWGPRGV